MGYVVVVDRQDCTTWPFHHDVTIFFENAGVLIDLSEDPFAIFQLNELEILFELIVLHFASR